MTRGRLISDGLFARAMRAAEMNVWKKAIQKCDGNVTHMANWLSVSRAWVHKRTAELGLEPLLKAARKDA